jgi:hypothetical protein
MYQKLLLFALLFVFGDVSPAQITGIRAETNTEIKTNVKTNAKTETEAAELKKQAVEFLREAAGEVNNLRTLENRISFSSEMASLMWFHDEKEARELFSNVITDFKQLIAEIDSQINAAKVSAEDAEMNSLPFIPNSDPKAKLTKRLYKAMSVREQIASAVSEHDALLAYAFFTETAQSITNPDFRKQFEWKEKNLEMRLFQAIAGQDAGKGLELGRKSLAKGVKEEHLELLKKIYSKDAEKGAVFGEEILSKLKFEGIDKDEIFLLLRSVLKAGIENRETLKNKPDQKPMLSEEGLRAMAEMMAQILLKDNNPMIYARDEGVKLIKPILPARAVQIEQKIDLENKKRAAAKSAGQDGEEKDETSSPYAAAAMSKAKQIEEQEKMLKDFESLGTKKLSDAEREKIIGQSRKMIAEISDPNAKMLALSSLAVQVGKMGDKELAMELMRESERFVSPQPKNYIDFMQSWVLSSSYAQIKPENAFPILEETAFRLNETIAAFIKVGEFIDVNGDLIIDGEVQIGGLGSQIPRGILSSLGATDMTLTSLAKTDFPRTKSLTDKFDRAEVRILAKTLVLRAILGNKQKNTEDVVLLNVVH